MQFILVLFIYFTSDCTLSITNLDIFRLGYILSDTIGQELVHIEAFLANAPILYVLKTLENQKASGVFRGSKMAETA